MIMTAEIYPLKVLVKNITLVFKNLKVLTTITPLKYYKRL